MDICLGCGAGCCRRYLIAVIPSDIERMAKRTGRKPSEFLQLFPRDECECVWAPPFFVSGKEMYVGLKREKHGCVFLRKGRCSVHAFKPLVCRTFPLCFDGERICVSNACARKEKWGTGDSQLLAHYHSELNRMRRFAVEWNWRFARRSEEELYSFLLKRERDGRAVAELLTGVNIRK